jgi:hypothetical protein
VPARARRAISARSVPDLIVTIPVAVGVSRREAEFSTVIDSDVPVVVDRTMTWDWSTYGSHAETAIPAPATTWYFAEGATHTGFQLFYLLQNPSDAAATVAAEFMLPAPRSPVVRSYDIPANTRLTVWANMDPDLAQTDVSAVFTSPMPIIAERAMYLDSPVQTFAAGHEAAGITAPATEWFLAEGATGPYFDLFILFANPNDVPAQCDVDFLLPDGSVIPRDATIAPRSRENIWVDAEGGVLADTAVATKVICDEPVVVERAMWWPGPTVTTWTEAHVSSGATTTGTSWALAEGEQGGARAVDTYILIANMSDFDGLVHVTLLFEDREPMERSYVVTANSRMNVAVGAPVDYGGFGEAVAGTRFGAVVESVTPTWSSARAELIVERSMYSNASGVVWAAGTNALATKLQ